MKKIALIYLLWMYPILCVYAIPGTIKQESFYVNVLQDPIRASHDYIINNDILISGEFVAHTEVAKLTVNLDNHTRLAIKWSDDSVLEKYSLPSILRGKTNESNKVSVYIDISQMPGKLHTINDSRYYLLYKKSRKHEFIIKTRYKQNIFPDTYTLSIDIAIYQP